MSEPPRQKPLPARPAFPAGAITADAHAPPSPGVPPDPDVSELRVSGRGGSWRVRLLGRSGRASARSAPLMLLGFSPEGAGDSAPTLEATVAGRSLAELSDESLHSALARAVPPRIETGKRPFFEDADQGGRS